MKSVIKLLPFVFALAACSYENKEGSFEESETQTEPKLVSLETPSSFHENVKVIKSANYRFEVKDLRKSTDFIEQLMTKYPAYIASSNLSQVGLLLENTLTIRVHSEYFESIMKEIDTQAYRVSNRTVQSTDVTKNFVDLESRLKTKREVEERYHEILRNKTGTIKEVLEAEGQIANLHEEIEATISKLNYLKSQVSYCSINLEFYQEVANNVLVDNSESTLSKFQEAFASGYDGMVATLIFFTYAWPLILGALILYFLIRYRLLHFVGRFAARRHQ